MGLFEKSPEKSGKKKKKTDFVSSSLPNSIFLKPSICKNLIKDSLNSD